jgi:HPt (histidine-containing phosphotransfer) domain-containing protein
MTANALQGDRQVCLAAGMDDYISKPIRVEELIRTLSRVQLRSEEEDIPTSPASKPNEDLIQKAIDQAVFQEFQNTMGGKGQSGLAQLIQDYLIEAQSLLESLLQAHTRNDTESIRRAAHSLKSSSMLFGAMHLAELCKTMEFKATNGYIHQDTTLLSNIETEFMAAQAALQNIIKDLESDQAKDRIKKRK